MKPASPALLALLASRQFYYADLYTFFLQNGQQLYYTSGDQDITADGITYPCGGLTGPFWDQPGNRAKSHWKAGTQVDTLSFMMFPGQAQIDDVPFLQAAQQGIFDGAQFQLSRAFMPTGEYGNTAVGTVVIFYGRVGEVDASRSQVTFSINSHLELFNQNMPHNMYQAGCMNTLYDASCTLMKTLFTVPGQVVNGSTSSALQTNLAQATGYFDYGVITFTSGDNNGEVWPIKNFVGGTPSQVNLLIPLMNAPNVGDSFTIYPGCDKTMNTCQNKFNNLQNFRGQPFVPEVSTAV